MPLGKLKVSQIEQASTIIKEIQTQLNDIIKNQNNKTKVELELLNNKIVELSSTYYTLIPLACGRKRPPIINTIAIISKYNDILDDLKKIVVAVKIIENKNNEKINQLDNIYNDINTKIKYVKPTTNIYKEIEKYIINSHGNTHNFKLQLLDIYEIERKDNVKQFNDYCKDNNLINRELLIHGSRLSNWISILQSNLLLDPSKLGVYVTGKMFGYGIYFANSFSKSAQYCGGTSGSTICFTLAEVALGSQFEKTQSDYHLNKNFLKIQGHDSTWGKGKMTPESSVTIKDVKIPNGKLVSSNINTSLNYDEKIVYDSNQFCMKYIVLAKIF
jgi:hypothetical protein